MSPSFVAAGRRSGRSRGWSAVARTAAASAGVVRSAGTTAYVIEIGHRWPGSTTPQTISFAARPRARRRARRPGRGVQAVPDGDAHQLVVRRQVVDLVDAVAVPVVGVQHRAGARCEPAPLLCRLAVGAAARARAPRARPTRRPRGAGLRRARGRSLMSAVSGGTWLVTSCVDGIADSNERRAKLTSSGTVDGSGSPLSGRPAPRRWRRRAPPRRRRTSCARQLAGVTPVRDRIGARCRETPRGTPAAVRRRAGSTGSTSSA